MRNQKFICSGFTLPELLLTAAILSYSLSMILATFVGGVALNETSRNLTTANSHAQFVLEDIRSATFAGIAASISGNTWTWNTATVTSKGLNALNSESITTTSSGSNPLDITVTVNWNDLHGRSRSHVLRTYVSG